MHHDNLAKLENQNLRLLEENDLLRRILNETDCGYNLIQQRDEFAKLIELGKAIVAELDINKVFKLVAETARDLISAELLIVPIIDANRETYTYLATSGLGSTDILNVSFKIGVGMCGWVLKNERPLLFGEPDEWWMDEKTRWEEGQQSALLVPLMGEKQIIGGLSGIGKLGGGSFSVHDLDVLSLFANQVSAAIENARLFQEVENNSHALTLTNQRLQEEIQERLRVEATMRDSEERYRTLLDQATDAIFVSDMNARFIDANREACEGLGYTREELLALSLCDVDPDFERERHVKNFWERLPAGKTLTIESSHRRKDGSLFPVETHIGKLVINGQPAILGIARDISERRQAEAERALERNYMQSLFEVNGSGMLVVSSTRHIQRVNNQFCNLFGYSHDELVGQNARILHIDQQHYEDWAPCFQEAKAGHFLASIDYPWRRKDGTVFWCIFAGVKIELPSGEPGVLWNVIDITKRKLAEKQLKAHQLFMQNALDALTHPFYVIDANDYTIKLSNKASHFGAYREGAKCFQLTHNRSEPCAGDDHLCSLREIKRTRRPVVVEHIHTDQNWQKKSVEVHAYPIFDSNGDLLQIIEYCLDISERKKGEEERRLLVTAIEQSVDSIVITDRDGMIQYVNPGFEQSTGYSKDEAIGQNPRILRSGRQDVLLYQEMWKILASGKSWQGHLINKKKDGTLFDEEVSITPILNEAEEITNYVAVKRNVTEQMKLEEQLRQSQKMESIGTLAGGIAHDFNNILSVILGYSELAKQALPPGTAAIKDIDQVINSGKRATALVQQILDFSRKKEQILHPLQPHLIVQDVLQMLRSTLPTTVEIQSDINPDSGTIMADATQIHQVVLNLCTNAFQALKDGKGLLLVTLSRQEKTAKDLPANERVSPGIFMVLSISDTGEGMDSETVSHIFDPYFTTKEQGINKGTGLGLAMVHGIIKGCNGFIEVKSEPGQGSTFRVFIPALENDISTLEKPEQQESLPIGTERILVIDDELLIVQVNTRILEDYGYTVIGVTDSREALEQVRAEPKQFDLIVTDQTMPGLTGSELAKAVLEIAPDMPIIICTGHSAVTSAEDAYAVGIKKYIYKPVDGNKLVATVRMVLDEARKT